MIRSISWMAVLLPAVLLRGEPAQAQAMTVFSDGSEARDCAFQAGLAAKNIPVTRGIVETCTRALEFGQLRPADTIATLVNRGIILAESGDYPAALQDYNKALSINPSVAEAFVGRGNLVFMAGRYDLAIAEYDKALSMELGSRHVALYNRGLAKEKHGLLDAARTDYSEALTLLPDWSLPTIRLEEMDAAAQ